MLMRRYKEWNRRKKGVAGIIAATILFAMIFTTGAAYFIFVQYNYQLQHKASTDREQMDFEQSLEQFTVSGACVGEDNPLYAVVKNNGPIPIKVVAVFIGSTATYYTGTPYPDPYTINTGNSAQIPTGFTYTGGNVTIKVVSERGNVVSGPYPLPKSAIASIASAVGPVVLYFHNFAWATNGNDWNGVNPESLYWHPGWAIPPGQSYVVWRLDVVNYEERSIQLDKYCVFWAMTSESAANLVWFILNTNTEGKLVKYSGADPIQIPGNPYYPEPNVDMYTIYFASKNVPDTTTALGMGIKEVYSIFVTLSGTYLDDASRYSQTLLPIQSVITHDLVNAATFTNTPASVPKSTPNVPFTLKVGNDGFSQGKINKVVLTVNNDFTSISATAPSGWSVNIVGKVITWTASSNYILQGQSLSFSWTATAPSSKGLRTHTVSAYYDNGTPNPFTGSVSTDVT
ncbi:MAG: hypothetical protein H3Z51_04085 [archaeon]|nr:hypothetical protein [archaeon]